MTFAEHVRAGRSHYKRGKLRRSRSASSIIRYRQPLCEESLVFKTYANYDGTGKTAILIADLSQFIQEI